LFVASGSELKASENNELIVSLVFLFFHCVFWTLLIVLKENKIFVKAYLAIKQNKESKKYDNTEKIETLTDNHHSSIDKLKEKIKKIINSEQENPFIIYTEALTKKFINNKLALKDLYLGIHEGEIYGLLGPNGAGKTTLFSILSKFLSKTSGDLQLNNSKIILSYCPQENILWPFLSVIDHLRIFSCLRGKFFKTSTDINNLLDLVKLQDKANAKVHTLSGGMKRRLSLALSLAGDAQLILLDEPTTGLDSKRRRELWDIVRSLKGKKTFILSTHIMDEAHFLCDRVGVLDGGQLRVQGKVHDITRMFAGKRSLSLKFQNEGDVDVDKLEEIGKIIGVDRNAVHLELDETVKIGQVLDTVYDMGVVKWELKKPSLDEAFHKIHEIYGEGSCF
jgi:ABC-type multidrug transport system ATPase subunit